jgi:hypothetical protein
MTAAPDPRARRPLHSRTITCEAFLRDDGLIDIEGVLKDTKPRPLRLPSKTVAAGEPIHLMRVCMTINPSREIVGVRASSEAHPYDECAEVEPNYQRLLGMKIDRGFSKAVKTLFASTKGCTHMTELLPPIATTAFQVIWSEDGWRGVDEADSAHRTSPINGCHALRVDSHVVQTYFRDHLKSR